MKDLLLDGIESENALLRTAKPRPCACDKKLAKLEDRIGHLEAKVEKLLAEPNHKGFFLRTFRRLSDLNRILGI